MLEEHENQETNLQDLIDLVERDDLPTNEFTIEDKDPMVILGKLNEVIAYLQTLQVTINASDSKANEALQKAIQAVDDATQALSVANGIDSKATQALANAIEAVSTANTALSASNTALSTANTAISTANTALSSANNAVETAENALSTADSAETKADTAITTANGAKTTAEGIDAKATTALSNSQTAVSTANTANDTANTANDTANTALTNSSNALTASGEANTKATQALATANTADTTANNANNSATGAFSKASIAVTTANEAKATAEEALDQVVAGLGTKVYRDSQLLTTLDIKPIEDNIANNTTAITALQNGKVDKVAGKQLSTEDYTTAEKNKLAGLNNYDDTQVQADITALQTRATNIETKNNEQDSSIETINNNFDNYLRKDELLNKVYPVGSIYISTNYDGAYITPAQVFGGSWVLLDEGYTLWTTKTSGQGEKKISAGLPNITGKVGNFSSSFLSNSGAFYSWTTYSGNCPGQQWNGGGAQISFSAEKSNSIYGKSSTVQPPAIKVYMWKRTA